MMNELSLEKRAEALIGPEERLDDLRYGGLYIFQKTNGFCFGTDAVLLSGFVKTTETARILDMGCGTGVIGLLLSARYPRSVITGLELQRDMADMAARSVRMNGLEDRMRIVEGDLREHRKLFPPCSYDAVVMNPPYTAVDKGPANGSADRSTARHEVTCTAHDMAEAAFYLLKNGGRLSVIYPAERIYELMAACTAARLEPKRIRLIQHSAGRAPKLLLMDAIRQGKPGADWLPPLILCEEDGTYTEETRRIYHMEE